MNNILFIDGGSHADVKKALRQWIDTYSEQLNPDFVFKIYKNGRGKHVIQADDQLDNDSFFFLVNYMQYPAGINYEIKIAGYAKGTGQNVLKGKNLLVFIPETDTEYDNVYVVTEANENYKLEFGRKTVESSEPRLYQKQSFIPTQEPGILKVRRKKRPDEEVLKEERSIENRLKWMFIGIISFHVFNFLIIRPSSTDRNISFENVSYFIAIGISLWLFWDYKVLQKNSHYLKCLVLVVVITGYLILLSGMELLDISKYEASVVIFPLIFLIIQWPLRYVFVQVMNREPIVERRPGNFPDVFYCCFLMMVPMFAALILSVPFFNLLR
ncbi:MAG: hypothetical protein ACO1N0_16255 [Fluviicola sp.]